LLRLLFDSAEIRMVGNAGSPLWVLVEILPSPPPAASAFTASPPLVHGSAGKEKASLLQFHFSGNARPLQAGAGLRV
jgi:hypothetical protein